MSLHDFGNKVKNCPDCGGIVIIEYDAENLWCPYCSDKVPKEDEEEPDCETCPNAMIVPVLGDDRYPVADAPECPFEECVYRRTDSL